MGKHLSVLAVTALVGCSSVQTQSLGEGRFLRFNHVNGDVVTQIDMRTPEYCRFIQSEMTKAAGANFSWGGAKIGCTGVDSSPLLPVRMVLTDHLVGAPVVIAANNGETCAAWVRVYLDAKIPTTDKQRYSIKSPCGAVN